MNVDLRTVVIAAAIASGAPAAFGHTDETLEEVVVYGRSDAQIGTASTASQGRVGFDDLKIAPRQRVGELVEVVPGMIATQHSGTGKANQYFLRGFNLDHGTDFSATAEGIPLNMRTHGHGQGYLDLNFLIPELVESVAYRKGPYHAAVGDFASAGSVDFRFYDRLDERVVQASIGEDGYRHGLVAGSADIAALDSGVFTAAAEITRNDGPWRLDEDLKQEKLMGFQHWQSGETRYRVGVQHYDSEWRSTDQIPQRAVDSGLIDELGFIDGSLGGSTRRTGLSFAVDRPRWHASLYAIDYDFSLYSNFSYFAEDPINGDQFEQLDRRRVYGGHYSGETQPHDDARLYQLRWGTSVRYDDIAELGLRPTRARAPIGVVRDDEVTVFSWDAHVSAELRPIDALRVVLGGRLDWQRWDVEARRPENGGSDDDFLFSPKIALAYRASDAVELYANWGRAFHTNDVRGTTIRVDPVNGDPIDAVDVFAESEGYEVGLRYESGRDFNLSLVAFWLDLDSELLFVGDAGTTEAQGASRRSGYEVSTFWQINEALAVNADYTWTDARFDDAPGAREIPGAVEETASVGVNLVAGGVQLSLSARYLGEAPLVEDNRVRADDAFLLHFRVAQRLDAFEWRLEAFNATDSNDYDIAYFYPSRLAGESEAVEDIHFHPLEPRNVRATVIWYW